MKRIRIYRHPGCARCARFARMHHRVDWLDRVETSTETPPGFPPLRMGQVVVEDLRTGVVHEGVAAFDQMCEHLLPYRPLRLLLRFPAFRARVTKDLAGDCTVEACAV